MSEQSNDSGGLRVVRPGVQAGMQDLGRFGYSQCGLSQGGAVDLHAHCWANRLLGNPAPCATVEMVIGMAAFRAESDLQVAIAGAEMHAHVDGVPVGNWCSFSVKQGQVLTLKTARHGLRAYLAVAGGFRARMMLGSVSTVIRNQLGGLLEVGDLLEVESSELSARRRVPGEFVADYPEEICLRVVESCQVGQFTEQALAGFYQSHYTVTQDSDRMGVRLDGKPVKAPANGLVSEGIALGAIQIPADGQPIILLNDRQTLGGYPKLGCVARVDLPKLAQARPGTRVGFCPVPLAEARRRWQEFRRYFGI